MANGETALLFHFNGISVIINHDLSPSPIDCAPPASQPRTYTWVRRMLILHSSTAVGHRPTSLRNGLSLSNLSKRSLMVSVIPIMRSQSLSLYILLYILYRFHII